MLLNTSKGTYFILQAIEQFSDGKFKYANSTGTLTNLTLNKVHIQNKQLLLDADKISIAWSPLDLLQYKLHFKSIVINNANIKYTLVDKSHTPLLGNDVTFNFKVNKNIWYHHLPIPVKIDNLRIYNTYIQVPNKFISKKPIKIDSLELKLNTTYTNTIHIFINCQTSYSSIFLEGKIGATYDLLWKCKTKNSDILNIGAKIDAEGTIQGTDDLPIFAANINAYQVQYLDYKLTELKANFKIDTQFIRNSYVNLVVHQFNWNDYSIDQIVIKSAWEQPEQNLDLLKVIFTPCKLTFPFSDGKQTLTIRGNIFQVFFYKDFITFKNNLDLSEKTNIATNLTISRKQRRAIIVHNNDKLQGTCKLKSSDLSMFSLISPILSNPKGHLEISYDVSGTFQQPIWQSSLNLNNFSADIKDAKLHIFDGFIKASSNNSGINYKASLFSGTGYLQIIGETTFSTLAAQTHLEITGKDFLAYNTELIKLVINPQLEIKSSSKGFQTTGTVFVPRAIIQPANYDEISTLPKEVEFISKEKRSISIAKQPDIYSNIKLILGTDVKIDVSGLKGALEGSLQMLDTPVSTTVSGDLDIKNGTYKLYGHSMKVTGGKLRYLNNSFGDPYVDITAIQNFPATNLSSYWQTNDQALANLSVGMHVYGKLDNIRTTLFSSPNTLSQADILSYITLGESINQANNSNMLLLLKAAKMLNVNGGNPILQLSSQIQKKLGLSKFGLEDQTSFSTNKNSTTPINLLPNTNTNNTTGNNVTTSTAFVLGKYLAPKLYIGYSFRIMDQVNVFNINYILNKYLLLRTEASTQSQGADLLYRIEKD